MKLKSSRTARTKTATKFIKIAKNVIDLEIDGLRKLKKFKGF